jgi:hypothetical protein
MDGVYRSWVQILHDNGVLQTLVTTDVRGKMLCTKTTVPPGAVSLKSLHARGDNPCMAMAFSDGSTRVYNQEQLMLISPGAVSRPDNMLFILHDSTGSSGTVIDIRGDTQLIQSVKTSAGRELAQSSHHTRLVQPILCKKKERDY